jgi:SAM-dependent methyltransferase
MGFNVLNSDIQQLQNFDHKMENYVQYDVTEQFHGKFDIVLSVSAIEHIDHDVTKLIGNLLDQVNIGGVLILTMDVPDVDLNAVENFLGCKCTDVRDRLNGLNSICADGNFADKNIVRLIIEGLL